MNKCIQIVKEARNYLISQTKRLKLENELNQLLGEGRDQRLKNLVKALQHQIQALIQKNSLTEDSQMVESVKKLNAQIEALNQENQLLLEVAKGRKDEGFSDEVLGNNISMVNRNSTLLFSSSQQLKNEGMVFDLN